MAELQANTARRAHWMKENNGMRDGMKNKHWLQVRADLIREMTTVLNTAEGEDRNLTDGEDRWYSQAKSDLEFVTAKVQAHYDELDAQTVRNGGTPEQRDKWFAPLNRGGMGGGQQDSGLFGDGEEEFLSRLRAKQMQGVGVGRKYADLFGPSQQASGFKSFNEFCQIVTHGVYDPRLMMAGMNEGIPSSGGYAVPVEYVAVILDRSLENEIVRSRAQVVPMMNNVRKVGIIANEDNSTSAPYGGLSLSWLDEAGSIGLKQAKLRMVTLNAKKAGLLVPISNELLEDGQGFDAQIGTAITTSVGWGLDDTFLNGNGAGKPLGVLNSPSLIVVAKETGQTTASFAWPNLTKMYSRMLPGSIPNSVFITNPSCIPALMEVQIPAGTAGVTYPALNERNGAFSLLGRPLLLTEKTPSVGLQGDLSLIDFSLYVIGLRRDITVDRSQHVAFSTDETYIRALVRLDGMPVMGAAFKPKTGPTLSWAVTLGARA